MTTQQHELEAWLGPAFDELTAEQYDRIARESDRIDTRYPDPDLSDLREAALSAAVQYLLGDDTLDQAGARLTAVRLEQARTSAVVQTLAAMACDDGMTEQVAAERGQIDRATVRKARGKFDRTQNQEQGR